MPVVPPLRCSANEQSIQWMCVRFHLFIWRIFALQVGLTPLHLAAECGHKELVGLLVASYKASVDAFTLVRGILCYFTFLLFRRPRLCFCIECRRNSYCRLYIAALAQQQNNILNTEKNSRCYIVRDYELVAVDRFCVLVRGRGFEEQSFPS